MVNVLIYISKRFSIFWITHTSKLQVSKWNIHLPCNVLILWQKSFYQNLVLHYIFLNLQDRKKFSKNEVIQQTSSTIQYHKMLVEIVILKSYHCLRMSNYFMYIFTSHKMLFFCTYTDILLPHFMQCYN